MCELPSHKLGVWHILWSDVSLGSPPSAGRGLGQGKENGKYGSLWACTFPFLSFFQLSERFTLFRPTGDWPCSTTRTSTEGIRRRHDSLRVAYSSHAHVKLGVHHFGVALV